MKQVFEGFDQGLETHINLGKLTPLYDRVLVRKLKDSETAGGIVLPENAKQQEAALRGEVLAIGPGWIDDSGNRVKVDVAVGDEVLFNRFSGTELRMSGEDLLFLSGHEILAMVVRQGSGNDEPTE